MVDDQKTNAAAAIEAGVELADANTKVITEGLDAEIPVVILPNNQTLTVLDKVIALRDARAVAPRRLQGMATHQELDTFVAHINRMKDADSIVWADNSATKLTAVLNYHRARNASGPKALAADSETPPPQPTEAVLQRWMDHRLEYTCPKSRQWVLWTGANGRAMNQETFADFIEQNAVDLAKVSDADMAEGYASPATLIEVARKLSIKIKGEFTRKMDIRTGAYTLTHKEDGEDPDSTKIPKGFMLGVPVFEGGEHYALEAQLRFNLNGGSPSFSYVLIAPDRIVLDAFTGVRKGVASATGLPIYAGTPEK